MTNFEPRAVDTDSRAGLSPAECHRLLGTTTFGRVGITSGGLPCILPVRYLYEQGAVVFRTGAGTKLRACVAGDVLAFEADQYDAASGTGWSVLALGRASVLTTSHEDDDVPTLDGPAEHGVRNHYVRLNCEIVSGRAFAGVQ